MYILYAYNGMSRAIVFFKLKIDDDIRRNLIRSNADIEINNGVKYYFNSNMTSIRYYNMNLTKSMSNNHNISGIFQL